MANSNTNVNDKKISKQNDKIRKKIEKQKNLEKVIESHSLKYYGYFTTILCAVLVIMTFIGVLSILITGFRLKKISSYIDTSVKLETTDAKSIDITPYVVSDLTGTTWELNSSITYNDNEPTYNINFNAYCEDNLVAHLSGLYFDNQDLSVDNPPPFGANYYMLRYSSTQDIVFSNVMFQGVLYTGINTKTMVNTADESSFNSSLFNRIINITGGTDVTNSDLISWLETNATMQQTTTQLTTPTITKTAYNQISWSAISNASGYAIYKDNVQLTTTNNTSYTATALGTYQVMAIGDNVNYSDSSLSNSISLTFTQLDTPTDLYLSNTGVLYWDSVTNATSYTIYDITNNQVVATTSNDYYTFSTTGTYQVKATSSDVFYTDSSYSTSFVVHSVTSSSAIYSIDVTIFNTPFYLVYYFGGYVGNTFNLNFDCVISNNTPNNYFLSTNDFTYNSSAVAGSVGLSISSDNKTLNCYMVNVTNDIVFYIQSHLSNKLDIVCTNGTFTIDSITGTYTISNNHYFLDNSNSVVTITFTADTGYIFDGNLVLNNCNSTFISNTDNLVLRYSFTNFINGSSIVMTFSQSITLNGNYAFIGSSYYNYYNLPTNFNLRIDFTSNSISYTNIVLDSTAQTLSYVNTTTNTSRLIFTYIYDVNNLYFNLNYVPQDTANYYFITINDFDISINDYENVFSHIYRLATYQDYEYLGYNNGLITANEYTMANLLFALGDTPIKLIKGLLNFNFFGVNLFSLFTLIVTLLLVFVVFKFIKGGVSNGKDK